MTDPANSYGIFAADWKSTKCSTTFGFPFFSVSENGISQDHYPNFSLLDLPPVLFQVTFLQGFSALGAT